MDSYVIGIAFALSYFTLFQVCGIFLANRVFSHEPIRVQLLFGSICGTILLQWLPVCVAFFLDFSLPAHIVAAALIFALLLFLFIRREKLYRIPPSLIKAHLIKNPFLVFILLVAAFFAWLVAHGFRYDGSAYHSSQATYGDMNMHLSFITSIARQQSFPPDYSLLPGTRLSYPFLPDSISSSLLLLGAPLQLAYALPVIVVGLQVLFGFYAFASRWLKNKKKAALAFIFFFFNGGFGLIYFLNGSKSFHQIFTDFYQTPTNLVEHGIYWVNTLVDIMLPQRTTLFGWASLSMFLYLLYRAVFEKQACYFKWAALIVGTLPMINTHCFLFAGITSLCWLISSLIAKQRLTRRFTYILRVFVLCSPIVLGVIQPIFLESGSKESIYPLIIAACGFALLLVLLAVLLITQIKNEGFRPLLHTWGLYLLIICLFALPQLIFWTFSQSLSTGFVRGCYNWINENDPYLLFYLKNIGFLYLLGYFALLFCRRKDFLKSFPVLAVWFLAEFICFQPNRYDNNKLLYPAFFFLCCLSSNVLVDFIEHRREATRIRYRIACISLVVLSMLPACLTMGREAVSSYPIYDSPAIDASEYTKAETEPNALFLTGIRHNNEIAALSGRNVLCGSPSFLYFHGLNYYENENAVTFLYEHPGSELFKAYQVDYILIGPAERAAYSIAEEIFAQFYECVYNKDGISIYRVEGS